jgi:hypothetical protein
MNHSTAEPDIDGIEARAAHGGAEFDPDHSCEPCSPKPVTMPPSTGPAPAAGPGPHAGPVTPRWA